MNPTALLSLISDLYTQLTAAQDRVTALEQELARLRTGGDRDGGQEAPDASEGAASPR